MAPTSSKVNKIATDHNPLKVRNKRGIVFNTKSTTGVVLSPKKALQSLHERAAVLRFQVDSDQCNERLIQELNVVAEEIIIGSSFMTSEAERAAARRRNVTKLPQILKNIKTLTQTELEELQNAVDDEIVERSSNVAIALPSSPVASGVTGEEETSSSWLSSFWFR